MRFFKNKHVITAMIVAPILAIASYYLVDLIVKEQPQPALAGQAYPLLAKSNCRFSSGECDLVNASFKSKIRVLSEGGRQILNLDANNSLQSAMIGFVTADGLETKPVALTAVDANGKQWATEFTVPTNVDTVVRVALRANDAHYFVETTMAFSQYETSFDKDFRKSQKN